MPRSVTLSSGERRSDYSGSKLKLEFLREHSSVVEKFHFFSPKKSHADLFKLSIPCSSVVAKLSDMLQSRFGVMNFSLSLSLSLSLSPSLFSPPSLSFPLFYKASAFVQAKSNQDEHRSGAHHFFLAVRTFHFAATTEKTGER